MQVDQKHKYVRRPAVVGQFYPARADELKIKISKLFNFVNNKNEEIHAKAVIVPHAGYDYSGVVAASAYKKLLGKTYNTVVIICNSHSDYFNGIAIDESEAWETPFGKVEIDFELAEALVRSNKQVQFNSEVHTSDHTLEVQLPFLQTVLKDGFKIVPIVFGNAENETYKILVNVLSKNLSDGDLLVISTDLSHYPTSAVAREVDEKTLEMIKAGNIKKLEKHIKKTMERRLSNEQTLCCGIDGVKTLMALARERNWDEVEILQYMNSGEIVGGDKSRVVGYGSLVFGTHKESIKNEELILRQSSGQEIKNYRILESEQKEKLLAIARESVEKFVRNRKIPEFEVGDERLLKQAGAFVTLKIDGNLRGCIGQIMPSSRPLWKVVQEMAVAASTEDPRFQPVSASELEKLGYEISVLSVPERISDWTMIKLGVDGVIVRSGGRSGVFLPQVALEVDWDLEEFLSHLCADKAGLESDAYKSDPEIEILTFQAQVF